MSLTRLVVTGVIGALGLLLVLLLVRPLIFSFAEPRDDANYTVAASSEVAAGPIRTELILNDQHGLPGEVAVGEHARIEVVAATDAATGFSVVVAWSPTNDCAVELGADRLIDCAGDAWTYAGIPIDPEDPGLVRLPAVERNGAVVADFTRPIEAGG